MGVHLPSFWLGWLCAMACVVIGFIIGFNNWL